MYKGILDGHASAVFNGRIIVRKDAQKTDSKQTNKNLVLSDNAVIHTKPELQIHADDVRCTHGATIGQLDAESMFYLQSRGIGKRAGPQLAHLRVRTGRHRPDSGAGPARAIRKVPLREISMSTLGSVIAAGFDVGEDPRGFPCSQAVHPRPALVSFGQRGHRAKADRIAVVDAIRHFHEVDCANIHRGESA